MPMQHVRLRRCVPRVLAQRCSLLLVAVLVWPNSARADRWFAAEICEVFSESREWFVRVVPGKSRGDTFGFEGADQGPYATAEWYRRTPSKSYEFLQEGTLANPIAPVSFLVTDRGYLVTLDNWHNLGYGTVVASYAPDGRRVAGYELGMLFSADEVAAFPHSASSIQWRWGRAYVREGQQSVYIGVGDGEAKLIYEPETGKWQYCENREGGLLCRTTNLDRNWAPYRDPDARR